MRYHLLSSVSMDTVQYDIKKERPAPFFFFFFFFFLLFVFVINIKYEIYI